MFLEEVLGIFIYFSSYTEIYLDTFLFLNFYCKISISTNLCDSFWQHRARVDLLSSVPDSCVYAWSRSTLSPLYRVQCKQWGAETLVTQTLLCSSGCVFSSPTWQPNRHLNCPHCFHASFAKTLNLFVLQISPVWAVFTPVSMPRCIKSKWALLTV